MNNTLKQEYVALFNYNGLPLGRMLSVNKSTYRNNHPENLVVFNANVLTEKSGKVYYGDIDCTLDEKRLQETANTLNEDLYVLFESDARFENENKPTNELLSKAVKIIKVNKQ